MNKKIVSFITLLTVVGVTVGSLWALTPLHQLSSGTPIAYPPYLQDESIPVTINIPTLGSETETVFWHFVVTEQVTFSASIKFTQESEPVVLLPYKFNNGTTHYGVITPRHYTVEDGWINGDGKFIFNLSHTATEPTQTTSTTGTTATTPSETTSTVPTETTTSTTPTETTNTIPTTTVPELPETGEEIHIPVAGITSMAAALLGGSIVYTIRKKKFYEND